MSQEFEKLQELVRSNQLEIKLKKSLQNTFGFWLHSASNVKHHKIIWKLFFVFYIFFSSYFFWIGLSVVMALKVSIFYLFLLPIPFLMGLFFKPIGHGFLLYDAQESEDFFNFLWNKNQIMLVGTKIDEDDVLISPAFTPDWRHEINRIF